MFVTALQIEKTIENANTDLAWTLSTTSISDGAPYFMAYIQRKTSKPSTSHIK